MGQSPSVRLSSDTFFCTGFLPEQFSQRRARSHRYWLRLSEHFNGTIFLFSKFLILAYHSWYLPLSSWRKIWMLWTASCGAFLEWLNSLSNLKSNLIRATRWYWAFYKWSRPVFKRFRFIQILIRSLAIIQCILFVAQVIVIFLHCTHCTNFCRTWEDS